MDCQLLAQLDFDNWIEIVVVLLLVGGSAFAAVAKKLTEVFTPKEPGQSKPTIADSAGKPHPSAPLRRASPAHPVARPMPPVARPYPPSPVEQCPVPVEPASPVAPESGDASLWRAAEWQANPPQPQPPLAAQVGAPQRRPPHPVPDRATPERGPSPPTLRRPKKSEAAVAPAEPLEHGHTIGRQTHRALRHAIVMREILGPPLALRPPAEQSCPSGEGV